MGRLDRETSGIMVFAKNQAAAARLGDQRKNGAFHKTYTALSVGELPAGSRGCIRQPIGRIRRTGCGCVWMMEENRR